MGSNSLFAVVGSKRLPVFKVSGGWTTVMDAGRPIPLRNSKISKFVDADGVEQAKPAAITAEKAPWPAALTRTAPDAKPAKAKPASRASGPKAAKPKSDKPAKAPRERVQRPDGWKSTDALKVARKFYAKTKKLDKDGKVARRNIDCADEVAEMLRDKTLEQVYKLCARHTGTPEAELRARYGALNVGMQRMNLGNRIRAVMEDGEE